MPQTGNITVCMVWSAMGVEIIIICQVSYLNSLYIQNSDSWLAIRQLRFVNKHLWNEFDKSDKCQFGGRNGKRMRVITAAAVQGRYARYWRWSGNVGYQRLNANGLLVSKGIVSPLFSVSAVAWYIWYLNLQFLNNIIIIKSKVLPFQA